MGNTVSLVASVVTPLGIGTAIGISMRDDVRSWYPTIRKPAWYVGGGIPPTFVFLDFGTPTSLKSSGSQDAPELALWSRVDGAVRYDGFREPPGRRHGRLDVETVAAVRSQLGAQLSLEPAVLQVAQAGCSGA